MDKNTVALPTEVQGEVVTNLWVCIKDVLTILTPSKNVKIFDFLFSSTSKYFDQQYIEEHTLAKHPRKHGQEEIVEQGGDYGAANLSIKQTVTCQL